MKTSEQKDEFGMLKSGMYPDRMPKIIKQSSNKLSLEGMSSYLQKNPLMNYQHILSSKRSGESMKLCNSLGSNSELSKFLWFISNDQWAHIIAGAEILDNAEAFQAELDKLFNEKNLINMLYEYRRETNLSIEELEAAGCKVWYTLCEAAEKPHLFGALQFLVETVVNINRSTSTFPHSFPIHHAAKGGNVTAMEYLVQKGAYISAKDYYGQTSLHYAAESGNVDAIKFCFDHGCDIVARTKMGMLPIHSAATSGNPDAIKLCLDRGGDINSISNHQIYVPSYALNSGNVEAVKFCLKNGASIPSYLESRRDNLLLKAQALLSAEKQSESQEHVYDSSATAQSLQLGQPEESEATLAGEVE